MSDETEEWRLVPGFPDYAASSLGRIKRVANNSRGYGKGKILKQSCNSKGYGHLALYVDAKPVRLKAHAVVCAAFHGPKPKGSEVAHWDNNRMNNRPDNLRWATSAENKADKYRHGTMACGERLPFSKFTNEEVRAIRASPLRTGIISELFGVSKNNIRDIRNGKIWKHLLDAQVAQ